MKRDMDLVRRMVLTIADAPGIDADIDELDGVEEDTFMQHAIWLEEAGLINAEISQSIDGLSVIINSLTWAGCDFADAIRDETIWNKAKSKVLKPGASWTFDILKDLVKSEITQGFPTLRQFSS